MIKKIGLIVNPMAGIGGRVGLKGSDGEDIVQQALAMGASPEAPMRAIDALRRFSHHNNKCAIYTFSGQMGEDEAISAGFDPVVIGAPDSQYCTTAEDTEKAASSMLSLGVDLIVFAGGDGTARNVYHAVGDSVPVLGIPAGVKIHSAVYANNPAAAGNIVSNMLTVENDLPLRLAEVMDIDENSFRQNRLSAFLYGYMRVPYLKSLMQGAKAGSSPGDEASHEQIASEIINNMLPDVLYIIGPGSTTQAIMRKLQLDGTLLGVDIVKNGLLLAKDTSSKELMQITDAHEFFIVVTVIGGQGHVFGRGNQQIAPEIIRKIDKSHILVGASESKLISLAGKPLIVDTGDEDLNTKLSGYCRVITGIDRSMVYRMSSGAE